jgi:SAM-dependent methyltransferase
MSDKLDLDGIRKHWEDLAETYGTNFRATTKTSTAKEIELHALEESIKSLPLNLDSELSILEAGCGNGLNLFWLQEKFPHFRLVGFDYIPSMIKAANSMQIRLGIPNDSISFQVASFDDFNIPTESVDIVFTVRAIINLNTDELQQHAILRLAKTLRVGGYLLLLENSSTAHRNQNSLREKVGLPVRSQAEYNHFIDEEIFEKKLLGSGLKLLEIRNFIGLHDILLYVLLPMINGGKIEYQDDLVRAATQLTKALSLDEMSDVGKFGQNRLFICSKIE